MPILDDSNNIPNDKIKQMAELVMALRNAGHKPDQIIVKLKNRGCSEADIEEIMQHSSATNNLDNKTEGKRSIIIGLVWLAVGFLIPFLSYNWAMNSGSRMYFSSYIIPLYGLYRFVIGIVQLLR